MDPEVVRRISPIRIKNRQLLICSEISIRTITQKGEGSDLSDMFSTSFKIVLIDIIQAIFFAGYLVKICSPVYKGFGDIWKQAAVSFNYQMPIFIFDSTYIRKINQFTNHIICNR